MVSGERIRIAFTWMIDRLVPWRLGWGLRWGWMDGGGGGMLQRIERGLVPFWRIDLI